MKKDLRYIIACFAFFSVVNADSTNWDLLKNYTASTHVFYGEVTKTLPKPNLKTDIPGIRLRDIDDEGMKPEKLIWPNAKELSFSVEEAFKEKMPATFVAYVPDPNLTVWIHTSSEVGDEFLVKPQAPEAVFLKLTAGDRGLFFVRDYWGSTIPVLFKVRMGKEAESMLSLLRTHKTSSSDITLESIVKQARAQEAAKAAQAAEELRNLEDDYYKILRIQDLEIRQSLLKDLIARMGFDGLWTYFKFKEQYRKEHGAYIPDNEIPSGPTIAKEKLWHDISGELKKIELILEARPAK